jgi:hypothetical protein
MPHDIGTESEAVLLLRRIAGELTVLREDRTRVEETMREHTEQIKRLTNEIKRTRSHVDDVRTRLIAHIDWARRAWLDVK